MHKLLPDSSQVAYTFRAITLIFLQTEGQFHPLTQRIALCILHRHMACMKENITQQIKSFPLLGERFPANGSSYVNTIILDDKGIGVSAKFQQVH